MKEKRIDLYLSIASLAHLVVVGVGGTYATEWFADNPRRSVLNAASAGTIIFALFLVMIYYRVYRKTKSKKWK